MNLEKVASLGLKSLTEIALIALCINVVFFTYGKTVEANVIEKQGKYLAKSLTSEIFPFLPTKNKFVFKTGITSEQETQRIAFSNSQIVQRSLTVFIGFAAILICAVFLACHILKQNFSMILLESVVVTIFVVTTEIIYLTFIGQDFIIVDTPEIKNRLVKALVQ